MNDLDSLAFTSLFKAAYEKCFGYPFSEPLSETESKLFYNRVFEATGLVVGWKSLKNYSLFVANPSTEKTENPSVATLDSLARYVSEAPYSSETERKDKESHYPWWFAYKEKIYRSQPKQASSKKPKTASAIVLATGFFLLIGIIVFVRLQNHPDPDPFIENFHDLSMLSLNYRGWFVQDADTVYWKRRTEFSDSLTLFTLRGDNWPSDREKTGIRNLLLRKITRECFETEVHFSDFLPDHNWQQAGILLLEDSSFAGKSVRLSVAYNDFFGGYTRPREIIIQAITSSGKNDREPEEIAHQPILLTDSVKKNPSLLQNIRNISLKIEKSGDRFRFLFAGGSMNNPAFREVVSHEFNMHPRFVGIFAMKGFVDSAANIPVHFSLFRLKETYCN